jgi:hypothetical protein
LFLTRGPVNAEEGAWERRFSDDNTLWPVVVKAVSVWARSVSFFPASSSVNRLAVQLPVRILTAAGVGPHDECCPGVEEGCGIGSGR